MNRPEKQNLIAEMMELAGLASSALAKAENLSMSPPMSAPAELSPMTPLTQPLIDAYVADDRDDDVQRADEMAAQVVQLILERCQAILAPPQ